MNDVLKARLQKAAGAGVLAIAAVLANWSEGREHKVYLDPVGIPTVCEGITGPDVVMGKTYTDKECDALLAKHLAIADAAVKRVIKVPLNDWQRAALIDFTFNMGGGALSTSTMARLFNMREYTAGCEELVRWNKARVRGKLVALPGLTTRRENEQDLCLNWK